MEVLLIDEFPDGTETQKAKFIVVREKNNKVLEGNEIVLLFQYARRTLIGWEKSVSLHKPILLAYGEVTFMNHRGGHTCMIEKRYSMSEIHHNNDPIEKQFDMIELARKLPEVLKRR